MKNIATVFLVLMPGILFSQWQPINSPTTDNGNIYHLSGNVGIGMSAPTYKLEVSGNIVNSSPSNGWIGLTGDLPGYSNGIYPTLKSNAAFLYFSGGGKYSGYLGGNADATFGLNNASVNTAVYLNTNGNSYFNGGNVGVGTSAPLAKLHLVSGGQSVKFLTGANSSSYEMSIGLNDDGINFSNNSAIRGYNFSNFSGSLLFLSGSGNVGIGTPTPSHKLDVTGNIINSNPTNGWIGLTGDLPGYGNGTYPTLKSNATYIYFSGGGKYSGYIGGSSDATFGLNDAIANTKIVLNTNGYTYFNGGNVGIGTTNPTQKLTVKGTVYSTEVKVDVAAGTGPDYVFANNYQLPTLNELKTYIDQHKHLPEVPSAKEMEANGVNLGEMNLMLLKKIEELTLYVIEQNKSNMQLKEQVNELQLKLSQLEKSK